jgi:hypothetical protein
MATKKKCLCEVEIEQSLLEEGGGASDRSSSSDDEDSSVTDDSTVGDEFGLEYSDNESDDVQCA